MGNHSEKFCGQLYLTRDIKQFIQHFYVLFRTLLTRIHDYIIKLGIDGSARKPALLQHTDKMIENVYNLAQYFGLFGAYLMTQ